MTGGNLKPRRSKVAPSSLRIRRLSRLKRILPTRPHGTVPAQIDVVNDAQCVYQGQVLEDGLDPQVAGRPGSVAGKDLLRP